MSRGCNPILRAALAGVLTMAVLSSSGIALAQEPSSAGTPDTVHLQNGTHLRGRVAEIIPGDHVSIVVGGETKIVPWADIARVGVNDANAQAPIGPPPAPTAPPPPVGPRARVRVESAKGGYLYRRARGTSAWVAACSIPCSEDLPIGDTYRVTSGASGTSKEFELNAAEGGQVDISIDPPSTSGMALGGTIAGVGGMVAYIGLLQHIAESNCYGCGNHDGAVVLGVGAAAMAAGIVLFVLSARTDVIQSSKSASAKAAPPPSTARLPMWRVTAETPATKPTMFPLLQATF